MCTKYENEKNSFNALTTEENTIMIYSQEGGWLRFHVFLRRLKFNKGKHFLLTFRSELVEFQN